MTAPLITQRLPESHEHWPGTWPRAGPHRASAVRIPQRPTAPPLARGCGLWGCGWAAVCALARRRAGQRAAGWHNSRSAPCCWRRRLPASWVPRKQRAPAAAPAGPGAFSAACSPVSGRRRRGGRARPGARRQRRRAAARPAAFRRRAQPDRGRQQVLERAEAAGGYRAAKNEGDVQAAVAFARARAACRSACAPAGTTLPATPCARASSSTCRP